MFCLTAPATSSQPGTATSQPTKQRHTSDLLCFKPAREPTPWGPAWFLSHWRRTGTVFKLYTSPGTCAACAECAQTGPFWSSHRKIHTTLQPAAGQEMWASPPGAAGPTPGYATGHVLPQGIILQQWCLGHPKENLTISVRNTVKKLLPQGQSILAFIYCFVISQLHQKGWDISSQHWFEWKIMYFCLVRGVTSLSPALTGCAVRGWFLVSLIFQRVQRSLDQNHNKL